jgi:Uncharacterized protein conserved in bacteria (DUF2334)
MRTDARNAALHANGARGAQPPPKVLRTAAVPRWPVRAAQRLMMKGGRLDWERAWLEPLVRARHELLGDDASGPPRFLVRVDEFPYATGFYDPESSGLEATTRFHEVMAAAELPYLMAVLPEPALDPLNASATGARGLTPEEVELVGRLRSDGVELAQHGTTHRTRHASPRRRSEFTGLPAPAVRQIVDRGRSILARLGIEPRVFVPPFNRFAAGHYPVLAERFAVVCGGPESVPLMGFHGDPLWRGEAVYLPSYFPLYGRAREILPAAERFMEREVGTWIPITLHTAWEAEDGLASLRVLADRIAPCSAAWNDFLADLELARAAA